MASKYFSNFKQSKKEVIKWRSHEVTRIEAFSDAVFAFAVSLLIISLEVPKNSTELLESLRGFIPFTFCFSFIAMIWYRQYCFFRRYGMHDVTTIFINCTLVLVVLFYVYPLKFMISALMMREAFTLKVGDTLQLLCFYTGGFAAIYFLFVLMYMNAHAKREELHLTDVEAFETRTQIYINLLLAVYALVMMLVGIWLNRIAPESTFAGLILFSFIGIPIGIMTGRRKKTFKQKFGHVSMAGIAHNPEE